MTRRALLSGLGAWALLATPAGAATVQLEVDQGYPTLTIVAAPGETNVVDVIGNRGEFSVNDPGAPLTAGTGCRGPAEGPVVCSSDLRDARVRIDLGDGDDRATATLPQSIPLRASGGPGDDELDGGDGDDVLQGGPGDDVLDGEYGNDVADYSDHTSAVVVDVTSPRLAGEDGERDVLSDIEGAWGGAGDDRIKAAGAFARCGAGRDRLTPAGDSGLRAAPDCELLAFSRSLAVERQARLRGRRLQFVMRAASGTTTRTLRVRAGGRSFTRRVRPDYGGVRRVSVRLSARVAARVRRMGTMRVAAGGTSVVLRVTR